MTPASTPSSNDGLWERIALLDGLELHLRRPYDERTRRLVEQIQTLVLGGI